MGQHVITDFLAARSCFRKGLCVMADVSNPDEGQQMVDLALNRFGKVDIAVSNVGLRPRQAFLDISEEDWRKVLKTNLSSAFCLARGGSAFNEEKPVGAHHPYVRASSRPCRFGVLERPRTLRRLACFSHGGGTYLTGQVLHLNGGEFMF
jgi:hypothetical protein